MRLGLCCAHRLVENSRPQLRAGLPAGPCGKTGRPPLTAIGRWATPYAAAVQIVGRGAQCPLACDPTKLERELALRIVCGYRVADARHMGGS